jgi:UDP-glucose 4-epimerase
MPSEGATPVRAVVLGATGFLGSNTVSELLKRRVEVVAFCPKSDRSRILRDHGIEVVEGDFLNPKTLEIPLKGVDWLIHLASTTSPKESMLEPHKEAANLTASSLIFQNAIDAGVRKVLFSSSGGTVYGDTGFGPVNETVGTRPVIPYTKTKLAIESELLDLADGTDTIPIILRFGNPYGPNQYPTKGTGVIAAWLAAVRDGKPIIVFGDGESARDFFYVSDAVAAITMALAGENARGIYNIGSGTATSLNKILTIIEEATNRKPTVMNVMQRPSDAVRAIALDSSKAKKEFGWETKVGLQQGIALTWKWIRAGEPFTIV